MSHSRIPSLIPASPSAPSAPPSRIGSHSTRASFTGRVSNDGSTHDSERSVGSSILSTGAALRGGSGLPTTPIMSMRDLPAMQQQSDTPHAASTYSIPLAEAPRMRSFKEMHGLLGGGNRSSNLDPLSGLTSGRSSPRPSPPSASTPRRDSSGMGGAPRYVPDVDDDGPMGLPSLDAWTSSGSLLHGGGAKSKSGIVVAVRMRPLRWGDQLVVNTQLAGPVRMQYLFCSFDVACPCSHAAASALTSPKPSFP